MKSLLFFTAIFIAISGFSQTQRNKHPLPTRVQSASQQMEFYLFAHFGPNTFTGKEWGEGTEIENVFNPSHLDCRQWCRVAKAAGAKGIIITAKHHDGFCLWPSKFSKHTVRESKWENGKGDVLKALSQACKEYGLKFGVYISPWDRNHPEYGTPGYNDVFVNMMTEIFTHYGPIWELWWDGANGEGPNGKKQVYDWDRFEKTVRRLSPNTVIFSDIGPDLRWCGNENGIAGNTNWDYLDTAGFARGHGSPPVDTLNEGNQNGHAWIPAECDVSIRPGWFYHAEEDKKVKTAQQLFNLYEKSVGRGANLLLNVPPDSRGQIAAADSGALVHFRQLRENNFRDNLLAKAMMTITSGAQHKPTHVLTDNNVATFESIKEAPAPTVQASLVSSQEINCIVLRENLKKGQWVNDVSIKLVDENNQSSTVTCSTIGNKRILTFPTRRVKSIVVTLKSKPGGNLISLSELGAYHIDDSLIEN